MAAPALAQPQARWASAPPTVRLRAALDGLYRACGFMSGGFLAVIGLTVVAQITARFFDQTIDSTESAGFCMAASAFFGLSYALRHGDHIRVNLLLQRLPPNLRHLAELWCCAAGTMLLALFTWFSARMALESYEFGDKSPGLLAMPFWIPQLAMVLGAAALTLALADDLVALLRGRRPAYAASEHAAPADGDVSGRRSGAS